MKNRTFSVPRKGGPGARNPRVQTTLIAVSLALVETAAAFHLGKEALAVSASRDTLALGPILVSNHAVFSGIISTRVLLFEGLRQMAIVLVLACAAMLTGGERVERISSFLRSFGVFIIAAYATRYLLLGAPHSLAAKDILLMLPRSLVMPVYIPLATAILLIFAARALTAAFGSRRVGNLTL